MYNAQMQLIKYMSCQEIIQNIITPYMPHLCKMRKVYIFGTKELGIKAYRGCIKQGVTIKAFIDNDISKIGREINGVKIYGLNAISRLEDDEIIIIATLSYWSDIQAQLEQCGIKQYVPYPVLSLYSTCFEVADTCFQNLVEDIWQRRNEYIGLFNKMADETSRLVLNDILLFRMSFDINYLRNAYNLSTQGQIQYFDSEIIHLTEKEVFVDAGAYKGETTVTFIQQVNGIYDRIYIFEPDNQLLNECKKNLKEHSDIVFYEAGTGDREGIYQFALTGGLGGKFCDKGEDIVKIYTLDQHIEKAITYIKMDVEGFELETIQGAAMQIMKNQPKLAISAYHKATDLLDIINTIQKMVFTYKIYLRHYTQTCFDIDLYFVNEYK